MDNNEKTYTEGIQFKSKFARWFDNYWYHYKWVTLGAIFLVIVIIVAVFQSVEKKKEDITLVYAGPTYITPSQTVSIQEVFNTVMPEDFDGKVFSIHGGGWENYLLYYRGFMLIIKHMLDHGLKVRTYCQLSNPRAIRFVRSVGFVPYRYSDENVFMWISDKKLKNSVLYKRLCK